MKVKITTTIKTNENNMWAELQKTSSLRHIASPILIFKPQKGSSIPEKWSLGVEYNFKLLFLGIIPLGNHSIQLVELDKNKKTIKSSEHSKIIRLWTHIITFQKKNNHSIQYTDDVEINAGILTLPIWLFSQLFYRYRQYRWRKFFLDNQSFHRTRSTLR